MTQSHNPPADRGAAASAAEAGNGLSRQDLEDVVERVLSRARAREQAAGKTADEQTAGEHAAYEVADEPAADNPSAATGADTVIVDSEQIGRAHV